jgi:hypothetical protein
VSPGPRELPAGGDQTPPPRASTVSIHVLRIGPDDVTPSIFKQLERFDQVGGRIWGWVDYHPMAACEYLKDHRHVLWQANDEALYHAIVIPPRVAKKLIELDAKDGLEWKYGQHAGTALAEVAYTYDCPRCGSLACEGADRRRQEVWERVTASPQLFLAGLT